MNPDLQTLLLRDNPWLADESRLAKWLRLRLPDELVPRRGMAATVRRFREVDRAHLVIGPRQAGKSTLIWSHLAAQGEPALFLDCEQPLVREQCSSAPLFLESLEKWVARPVPLFFEEAQHLENAGLFIKGLVDRKIGVPVLVTGSSSYHLGASTRESLAGRATRTRLLPFSLAEVTADLGDRPPLVRQKLLEERFERHLRIGGYPAVWLADSPETLLADLVEAFILRDASDLFSIQRPDAFRRLLHLLAGQVGSAVNLTEWASILGLSRHTVGSYLEILQSSHVAVVLPPFAGGKRAELTRQPKIYLVDNGIRHQLLHDFKPSMHRPDAGPMLESWVLGELLKTMPHDATLHFWRSTSGAEVDFVLVRGERIVGVEVKAGGARRAKLSRGVHSFIEAYRPERIFLVNSRLEHREALAAADGRTTEAHWLFPPDLAQAVSESFAG